MAWDINAAMKDTQRKQTPIQKFPAGAKPLKSGGYTQRMPNGNVVQVNPNGTRYVIKRAGAGNHGQNNGNAQRTTIETPAQIEERVRRMATEAFNRERNAVREEADRLKLDAESRRRGMQEAYKAAALMNSGMGADVQAGWNAAADKIQGLAQQGTGSIADMLRAETASQDEALARVGATGTGFDATGQAGVEAYRGGTIPAEFFTRAGGIGREWMNGAAGALGTRGLQEGIASERQDVKKIDQDLLSQIRDLTLKRTAYESDLRSQLLGARSDQLKIEQDKAEAIQKLRVEQAKLDSRYTIAKMQATTAAEKLQVDRIYKAETLRIKQSALDISRFNAETSRINSETSRINALTGGGSSKGKNAFGLTPNQQAEQAQKADTLAQRLFYGQRADANGKLVDAVTLPDFDPTDPETWGAAKQMNYQTALKKVMTLHKLTSEQAQSILNQYWPQGEFGRSPFDPNERKALEGMGYSKKQIQQAMTGYWHAKRTGKTNTPGYKLYVKLHGRL